MSNKPHIDAMLARAREAARKRVESVRGDAGGAVVARTVAKREARADVVTPKIARALTNDADAIADALVSADEFAAFVEKWSDSGITAEAVSDELSR